MSDDEDAKPPFEFYSKLDHPEIAVSTQTISQCFWDQKKRKVDSEIKTGKNVITQNEDEGGRFRLGDLVLSFTGDINHPAVKDGHISPCFVMLGTVVNYRRRKWEGSFRFDRDSVVVNWMTVEAGGKRYHDMHDPAPKIKHGDMKTNIHVQFDYVRQDKLWILSPYHSNSVKNTNEEIQSMVWRNFIHRSSRGWVKKHVLFG